MMKFFRKHNKKLLAVFMALLLVVWLGGSALTALVTPDRSKEVLYHSKYGDIRQVDQTAAQNSTGILERFLIPWQTLGRDPESWPGEPLSMIEWILLTREARAMGVRVVGDELDNALSGFKITDDTIRTVATRNDVNPERIRDAFAEFYGILVLQNLVLSSALPSEAEIRVAARDALEKVRIKGIVLNALDFIDPDASFTDEEIEAHFQEYREAEPVPSSLTFGYYQPPRVQIEYIQVDRERIKSELRVSDEELDRKARDYWRMNKEAATFRRAASTQPTDDASTQPATTQAETQPATNPTTTTQPSEPEFYKTYSEAREAAHEVVREDLAEREAQKVIDWLGQQFAEPFYDAHVGSDLFKVTPDAVTRSEYVDDVLAQIPRALAYPDAVEHETTDWTRQTDAVMVPGIGAARVSLPEGRSLRLSDLAFQVKGLAEIPKDQPYDKSLFISQYQFSPLALTDASGNLYLFRVVDVEPGHALESVDSIRDQVVEDLRLKRAFEEARSQLESLKESAVELGDLAAAWDQAEGLKEKADEPQKGLFGPVEFPRHQMGWPREFHYVPSLGTVDEDFIDACFALADEASQGPKFSVIALPATARVVLAEGMGLVPMTSNQYAAQRMRVLESLTSERQSSALNDWLTAKQIRARADLQPARAAEEKPESDESGEEDEGEEETGDEVQS